jgi:hypothetical protein
MRPLRVMFYDRTCRGRGVRPGLSHAWSAGGLLYKALGRIDLWHGVASWAEALDWLEKVSGDRTLGEIQYWGHGQWGGLWIDEELLTIAALEPGHPAYARLATLRSRMAPDALWWFRCCDVFGTETGHQFARAWTRFFNCRAAGHTYTIHILQSGLHVLGPDEEPTWPVTEGVKDGWSRASNSHLLAPKTITMLTGKAR